MPGPSHPSASVVFVQHDHHRTEQRRQPVRLTTLSVMAATLAACTPAAVTRAQPHLLSPLPFPTSTALPAAAIAFSAPAPLIVQIENSPASRPLSGLSDA